MGTLLVSIDKRFDAVSLMAEEAYSITKVTYDHELYLGAEGRVD